MSMSDVLIRGRTHSEGVDGDGESVFSGPQNALKLRICHDSR